MIWGAAFVTLAVAALEEAAARHAGAGTMFVALARLAYHHRWKTLGTTALVLCLAIAVLLRGGALTTGSIRGTEAEHALRLAEGAEGLSGDSVLAAIFSSPAWEVSDPRFISSLREALDRAKADPEVETITSPLDAPPAIAVHLISADGHHALALIRLKSDLRSATRAYPRIRAALGAGPLQLSVTGKAVFLQNLDVLLERDLHRAELISLPLALLVLLIVFRTLISAALPIGVGGLAVLTGVAGVLLLSQVTEMAQYTINVVSLIGLGVAIDYSLFITSRFRDELRTGSTVEQSLIRALDTSGRAVAFSGLAVAVGLAGLLFYTGSYLSAMGLAGTIVVGCAVVYALTFLPALLAVLGPRINAGRVPIPTFADRPGIWHALSTRVMKHPVAVLLPTLAVMLAIGMPFLRLQMAATDITALPRWTEARRGAEQLAQFFPFQAATRILVAVEFPDGDAFSPQRVGALFDASRRFASLPGVIGVESIVNLDPRLDRDTYLKIASAPRAFLPPEFEIAANQFLVGRVALFHVLTAASPTSPQARELVKRIRENRAVGEGRLWVGGQSALDVDSMEYLRQRTPRALVFVTSMMSLVLFFLLGSVLLPLKALAMNLLSIAGSFGALVWIFQDGHFHRLLRFEPGPIEPSLPVLLFCAVFGLSMDYEVLMLTRMQEEFLRTGDNTHSVAEGLERTGGLITSAAAIMVAVFAAFSLATAVVVKAMGLGMAVAVALDATLVRTLIVPSTMRLFGNLNWWAPKPIARWFAARRGLSH